MLIRVARGMFPLLLCVVIMVCAEAAAEQSVAAPRLTSLGQAPSIEYRFLTLYNFQTPADGGPIGRLLIVRGELFGTTRPLDSSSDTVFQINGARVERTIYRSGPATVGSLNGDLIDVNGSLFGTAGSGGTYGYGAVFKLMTAGGVRILHSFRGGNDGATPSAGLIDVNGNLYGTTFSGGGAGNCSGGCGTVFVVTPSGTERVLHRFGRGTDGQNPDAPLINVDGRLYGTTTAGGSHGNGSVFDVTLSGAEHVLYSFGNASDGTAPEAGLTAMNGRLYGTAYGGTTGCGTVFELTLSGKERLLYSFSQGQKFDGCGPEGSLTDVGGVLFGTTYNGFGPYSRGAVFAIDKAGVERLLYGFRISEGAYPLAGLLNVDGTLYGTTNQGGFYGEGTVFELQL